MNGPEHYQQAERLLSEASYVDRLGNPRNSNGHLMSVEERAALIAKAQVHATLALASATGLEVAEVTA